MRCHEARELCGPYLDSELDARTSLEIEHHLEHCAECARVFEAERKMEERIVAALSSGQRDAALWRRIEGRLVEPHRSWHLARWIPLPKPVVLGAAVVVVALLALWPRERELDLAAAVAADHEEYLAGQLRSQFDTQPPTEVLAPTEGRLDAEAFDKLPVAADFRAEGKRLCHLAGVPVAWTLARLGELPVSVVVLRREELQRFPEMRERIQRGHAVVCSRAGRFQFAARVVGDHVVCAVAETSRARLEELVKTVPGSS